MRGFRCTARHLAIIALIALPGTAFAQESDDETDILPEPEFHCEDENLPEDLAQFCAGFDDVYRSVMSRPGEVIGTGTPIIRSSIIQRPLLHELTGRGLTSPSSDLAKSPFEKPGERGVGLRVRGNDSLPVEFATEIVQPGTAGSTAANWELKTKAMTSGTGFVYGAATGGSVRPGGITHRVSGYAGMRSVSKPYDNVEIGAELAPRFGISDFAAPIGSMVLEPKLSAKSDLGRLGTSDFFGTLDAGAGYSVPLHGDPSAWGSVRLKVRPK